MFHGEAFTTNAQTGCRFDMVEAEMGAREISFPRAANRIGSERGRPDALPTMTALDFRSLVIIHIVQGTFR
jgi:hypothetical protein